MKDAPTWLTTDDALAIHEWVLKEHGGSAGVRDMALLESALGRARQHFAYGESDLFTLAATLAHGIANDPPFVDGNKRVAFMAAYAFLGINVWELTAPEEQAALMTLGLADKSISSEDYARWLRDNCVSRA